MRSELLVLRYQSCSMTRMYLSGPDVGLCRHLLTLQERPEAFEACNFISSNSIQVRLSSVVLLPYVPEDTETVSFRWQNIRKKIPRVPRSDSKVAPNLDSLLPKV